MAKVLITMLSLIVCQTALASPSLHDQLTKSGFTCQTQTDGELCELSQINSATFHYSQPIVIGIPRNFTSLTQVILHLHGFRGVCEAESATPFELVNEFSLLQQMNKTGFTHSILVFPLSLGQCTTFENELTPNFSGFVTWVNSVLNSTDHHWSISGHSGAYLPIGQILGSVTASFIAQIQSLVLLDATYTSSPDYFRPWQQTIATNPNIRVSSVYRAGTPTQPGSEALEKSLPAHNARILASQTPDHCQVPNFYFGSLLSE